MKGLNEQNPERGIETPLVPDNRGPFQGLNEQNPERGIETRRTQEHADWIVGGSE